MTSDTRGAAHPSIGIVVGGTISENRRKAAQTGEQPRVDVLEMEQRFSAKVYDHDWLKARAEDEWATRLLVRAFGRFGRLSEALALRLAVEAPHHDAIYATGEDVGLLLGLILRVAPVRRPKLVMRVEQLHYGRTPLRKGLYRAFTRLAGSGVDKFVCRTHAYERYLRDELRFRPESVTFAPEPVDQNFFDPARVEQGRPDFVPKGPFVFSAGLEFRDYDTLVAAARDLPLEVVIAAGSPWSHNRYEMKDGVQPQNVIMRRFTPREMRELYARAEAVVVPLFPSLRACGMNVINESSQMNCPVIATRTEGLESYIVDGGNGVLVSAGDVASLRSAIMAVVGKKEDFKDMTSRAHTRTTTEAPLERYVSFIYDLLSEPRSA
ncbi:MAG TPA: glycosyltransferase family 4 protein [Polyangiaceae bacterium]|nr:glycosyltransferase family 4 protein [Polyangiaceae bacterium]